MTDNLWRPYSQMKTALPPLAAASTRGSRITLTDGRVLIDGIASWWTACHGYNHPLIADAVARQLARMPHVMFGGLTHEPAQRLAARLAALLPGDLERVFFSDSGSVSVEVAIKMAAQYWLNQGVRDRGKLVAFRGGYHGDTFAAMSVCDPDEGMHGLFAAMLPQHHVVALPHDEAAHAAFDGFLAQRAGEVAAILIEPLVQGAGGMLFHDPAVLRRLRASADRHGILLILDEVFTGFGRTGSLFACEQAGIVPDIITLSKALTGGTMGLAATVARRHVFEAFWSDDPACALMHGPTFMANPLACAAAHASLDLFDQEDRLGQVAAVARQLETELAPLRGLPGVRDVRVRGAIGVVQLDPMPELNALKSRLIEQGVWIRPFRDIVYLTPAFTIAPDELSRLTGAIHTVLRAVPKAGLRDRDA